MIPDRIIVRNYKCFDADGGGFDCIKPINIIIGKNNSGKSSLLDLVQFLIQENEDFLETGRNNSRSEVIIEHDLTFEDISKSFKNDTSGGGIPGNNHLEYGKQFIGKKYKYSIGVKGKKSFISGPNSEISEAKKKLESISNMIQLPFDKYLFCKITAERDVVPETSDKNVQLFPNGSGATNMIQHILNRTNQDSSLIEKELLKELNIIVNPDIIFTRILVQLNSYEKWEIYFEDYYNNRIALSKMGSGVKTVLLVLLNLIVSPKFSSVNRDTIIFAFEELENNLHPAMQRRLYSYIKEYSAKNLSYFFLTTHSNIVIDAFGTDDNSQILHVIHDGVRARSSLLYTYIDTKRIIKDLGLKASDILQSNGIIWVEGPSDRNYLNRWITLLAPELKEGFHYSIMFYGGRLLSNLTFDFEWFNKEVIPLIKINSNAYVILDRDGKTFGSKINETKKRISTEIGETNFWITKGREIENYLHDEIITKWLKEKHGYNTKFKNDKNLKLEENISCSSRGIKLKYNLNKTVFSSEISQYINNNSLCIMDLDKKLNELIEKIKNWNA